MTSTPQMPALPATLRELTLHEWGAEHPLRVDSLTQLQRLTLFGSAYRGLVVSRAPADPVVAAAAAASMLLPASLRTAGAVGLLRHQ